MKIKRHILVFLAILAAIAAMVVTAAAQRAGFRAAGIAPPVHQQSLPLAPVVPVAPFITAPVMPFFTAPVAPFGFVPGGRVFETFQAPGPIFFPPVQPPAVVHRRPFRQHNGFGFGTTGAFGPVTTFGTNGVIVNVPQAFPQEVFPQTVVPQSNIGLPPISPIPTIPATISTIPPTISTIPATVSMFPAGTTRAQVISQLGPPSVTVITSNGETLYFQGGTSVVFQNGQVVTGSR
jgi:hypothetical protein